MNRFFLDDLIARALAEDVGYADLTTEATVPETARADARFLAKEDGVLCGLDVCRAVFCAVSADVVLTSDKKDGDAVRKGEVFATITGPARAILAGERVALNLLQHLSGVATRTRRAVDAVKGYKTRIADTRKTTPGLRALEKYAVRCGGGSNHRFNLTDGVLIKDNHIAAAGSIADAVQNARRAVPHTIKIEVETETIEQVREALDAGAEVIMLDNMSLDQMREAVAFVDGRAITEASGNMGDKDLKAVAETGVDLISIGALTHSVKALDISLKF